VAGDPLTSPVVVDGIVSEEKVAELLALQTEYPELDYKSTIEIATTAGLVELVKDVGAMRVRGGYILGGVDDRGGLTGLLDDCDQSLFDEARLAPKFEKYLGRPLQLRTNLVTRHEHLVVVICVLPSPAGCTFLVADGQYEKNGKLVAAFRKGDVFGRDGTRSARLDQPGLEEVIRRRIQIEKEAWIAEQQEIRRREQAGLDEAYRTRRLGEGPLGSVTLDLGASELVAATLDLVRRDDSVALRHIFRDAEARAREYVTAGDIDVGLTELLDKLACLAATFIEYEQFRWLAEVVTTLVDIYAMPLQEGDVRRFGYSSRIAPDEVGPRVWLAIIEHVFAVGALAVRREDWRSIRTLTLQLPRPWVEDGYEANWLRHALTMASRAQQFDREEGQNVSLLSLARNVAARLDCLRPDGLQPESDELLTSLAQFDLLADVVAVTAAGRAGSRVFYPNFARYRQHRVQSAANLLVADGDMRQALLGVQDDEALAGALAAIGDQAQREGWRYDGFDGWERTPVQDFINQHAPK
jgi:hypothetical protein